MAAKSGSIPPQLRSRKFTYSSDGTTSDRRSLWRILWQHISTPGIGISWELGIMGGGSAPINTLALNTIGVAVSLPATFYSLV